MKFPFSQRETLNIDEAVTDTDFFIDSKRNLKNDRNYYAKVQCQLFFHVVVWTPLWLHITEIKRDVQFMTKLKEMFSL